MSELLLVLAVLWVGLCCYLFGRVHQKEIDDRAIFRAGEVLTDFVPPDVRERFLRVFHLPYDQDQEV